MHVLIGNRTDQDRDTSSYWDRNLRQSKGGGHEPSPQDRDDDTVKQNLHDRKSNEKKERLHLQPPFQQDLRLSKVLTFRQSNIILYF